MVDSNCFRQFNRQLIREQDFLYLTCPRISYSLKISVHRDVVHYQKVEKYQNNKAKQIRDIKAVYGIIKLQINKYMAVVTKSQVIGQIYGKVIFRASKIELVCLSNSKSQIDQSYVEGLNYILNNASLFYSLQYDLTQNLQSFVDLQQRLNQPRNEFFYNQYWMQDFTNVKAFQWITFFISGFIRIDFIMLDQSSSAELAIISRRNKNRQGLRYLTRGSNSNGDAANACQTETILYVKRDKKQSYFSYVQIRGSFPFIWQQPPELRIKPKPVINESDQLNLQVAKKHYQKIGNRYGKSLSVNLVNKTGLQRQIGDYFQKIHNNLQFRDHQLIWFDFHMECKNSKYENLGKLIDLIQQKLSQYKYFHIEKQQNSSHYINKQEGTIRTNCMDCLDRTNVVQSLIAKRFILKWLSIINISSIKSQNSAIQKLPLSMTKIFRDQWTQNANTLSHLYAGTGAMKTDFIFKGKRSFMGALTDLKIGIQRFFLGNFYDSRTQDYIHLSLGQIKPGLDQNNKIRHSKMNSIYVLSAIVISIPFIVNFTVNQFYDEQSSKTALKVGLSLVGYSVLIQGARIFKSFIIHKLSVKCDVVSKNYQQIWEMKSI